MKNNLDLDKIYPFLVNDVMQYIEAIKQKDRGASIIDIIMDYARHENIDVEIVGDAISSDVYLKSFIEKDCQTHNIFRSGHGNVVLGEW